MIKFKLTSHIDNVIREMEKEYRDRMKEATHEVRNETLEVLSGPRHGRQYRVPGTKRKYTASAPGEAPATATAELRQSVGTKIEGKGRGIIGYVGSDSDHAKPMEFGTKTIAPRPWLRVAFERAEAKVKSILSRPWL